MERRGLVARALAAAIVTTHFLDEPLRVLATDEHLERAAEREVGREGVVDDRVDDHDDALCRSA